MFQKGSKQLARCTPNEMKLNIPKKTLGKDEDRAWSETSRQKACDNFWRSGKVTTHLALSFPVAKGRKET